MKFFFAKLKRTLKIFFCIRTNCNVNDIGTYEILKFKTIVELYSLLMHETHRIEKASYNDLLRNKKSVFDKKVEKIKYIQNLIVSMDPAAKNNPVIQWCSRIIEGYPELNFNYVEKYSTLPRQFNIEFGEKVLLTYSSRRSCRLWGGLLDTEDIRKIIIGLIRAIKWAPNSGNRQGVRIKPLIAEKDRHLLIGLKERHCYSAPLVIFVGVDKRVYGAISSNEECIYLDAAAAIMQMILYIHSIGLGSCWNHFGLDMINSRSNNVKAFNIFKKSLNISDYIIPIALISIGVPKLITPAPERMPDSFFLLD